MTNVSRRSAAKGAAWSVPAVAVAAAAPAVAASTCTPESRAAIDAAFQTALATQGALTINFYQSIQSANGFVGEAWANLRNDTPYDLVYTQANPLVMKVEVIGLTGDASERSMTNPSTSWGSIADGGYNPRTKTRTYTWTFTGTVPSVANRKHEADMWFHFQDGVDFGGRITNALAVTPIASNPPAAPTWESIVLDATQQTQCLAYYNERVADYNLKVKNKKTLFYQDGSKDGSGSRPYGDGPVAIGQQVRSDVIGDFRPAGGGDGIY